MKAFLDGIVVGGFQFLVLILLLIGIYIAFTFAIQKHEEQLITDRILLCLNGKCER